MEDNYGAPSVVGDIGMVVRAHAEFQNRGTLVGWMPVFTDYETAKEVAGGEREPILMCRLEPDEDEPTEPS